MDVATLRDHEDHVHLVAYLKLIYRIIHFQWRKKLICSKIYTEAKRCFATHDEDIDYFNMRIYIILIACVYIQQFNFVH